MDILKILPNLLEKKNGNGLKQLKSCFDEMTNAFLLVDKDFKIVFANKMFKDILGVKNISLTGKTCYNIIFNHDKPCRYCPAYCSDNSLLPSESVIRYVGNGQDKILKLFKLPLISRQNINFGALVSIIDITGQNTFSRARKKDLFDELYKYNTTVRLIVEPENGHVLDANEAAVNFYGYSKKIMQEKMIHHLHASHPKNLKSIYSELQYKEVVVSYCRHIVHDGSYREVEEYVTLIQHNRKKVLFFIINDLTGRNEMLKALQRSENQYRYLVETIPYGIVETDANYNILFLNKAFSQMTGYSFQELFGKNLNVMISGLTQKLSGKNLFNSDFVTCLRAKTRSVDVQVNWRIKKEEDNEETGYIIVFSDITYKRESEEKIYSQKKYLDSIIKTVPIGIGMVKDRAIEFVNKQLEEITGYNFRELNKQKFLILYPDENEYEKGGRDKNNFVNTGETIDVETKWKTKKGFVRDIYLRYTPVDPDNFSRGIIFTAMDITMKKVTEKLVNKKNEEIKRKNKILQDRSRKIEIINHTLEESEKKYKTFIEEASEMVIVHAMNGKIKEVNKKTVNFLGYPREKMLAMNISEIDTSYRNKYKNNNPGSMFFSLETLYRRIDGAMFPVEVKLNTIKIKDKSFILIMASDITGRKEAERNILKAVMEAEEREKKRLAEDLHDELGPFLAGIKLYINEISEKGNSDEDKEVLLLNLKQLVDEAIEKTRGISNSLLPGILRDFGILKALNSFIKKIKELNLVDIQLNSNTEKLGINKDTEVGLYRIVIEMINNTLKHAEAKNISIVLYKIRDGLTVTYSDDGVGFNLENALKNGKGLGVNNILNRIRALNGDYQFFSKKGKGIRFIITIKLF